MFVSIIRQILILLFTTLVIEELLALALRVRGKDLLIVMLTNFLTNPLLQITTITLGIFMGPAVAKTILLGLEVFVVLLEGFIYLKAEVKSRLNPFLLSLSLNAGSYLLGLLITMMVRRGL